MSHIHTEQSHTLSGGLHLAQRKTNPFLAVFVLGVTSILGPMPITLLAGSDSMASFKGQLIMTVAFIGWTALLFAWVKFYEKRPFASLGFNKGGVSHAVKGGLVGFVFSAIVVGINVLLGQATLQSVNLSALLPALVLLVGFAIQGSQEEIAYRGFLMQNHLKHWGLVIAMVVQAVLFLVLHLGNGGLTFIPVLNMLLVSVFLGVWAYKADNLWGVCGFHVIWNWTQGNIWGANVSNLVMDTKVMQFVPNEHSMAWLTGGSFGLEGSILVSLLFVVGIALLLKVKK